MKTKEEIQSIIAQSIGTTQYYKFSPFAGYPVITDGVYAVAEAAECYWLLDIIGSYQGDKRLDKHLQVWKLVVNHEDATAIVTGSNDTKPIISQKIHYTDFPLDELTLYLIEGVILLPNEY